MSFNGVRRRLQRDINKLPRHFRSRETKNTNRFVLPTFEQTLDQIPESERATKLTQIGITEGDLVYITEGEHKGQISTVFQYTPEYDSVFLSDVSEKKIIPKFQWFEQQESHLIDYPKQIPKSHVRLAAKDRDDKGNTYYLVADELVYKQKYYDHSHKKWLPRRFIKHHDNIEIPWPAPPREFKEGDLSTDEETVLEKSYELQSLVVPPFPSKILNELRNPYSKYKAKYLTEAQARRLNAPTMPLTKEQQIYLAKKEAKAQQDSIKQQANTQLTPEIQDYIGERIANHLNQIDNPYLKAHLDSLTKSTIPEFSDVVEDEKH